MTKELDATQIRELEAFIDDSSLEAVLQALSSICGLKSGHIRQNWNDKVLARQWDTAEGVIAICSTHKAIAVVSGEGAKCESIAP